MTAHSEPLRMHAAPSWGVAAKRAIDVLASAIGLALLVPFFAVIAVAIWIEDRGPIFYRQVRIGRAGRPFKINKFRSMSIAQGDCGSKLTVSGDARVTRVGAFLRRAKLDELPQLLNVLTGEMSLVGPRPEVPEFINDYVPSQRAVMLSVRPGMTDYASVLLRNESDLLSRTPDPGQFYRESLMPFKYELCLRYVSEMGPRTDVRVILATIWSVVVPSGRNPLIDPAIYGRFSGLGVIGTDDVA
jgi:lipopolysaccharide/colanic/teichoic acid biosynthesis glycosyltransferase